MTIVAWDGHTLAADRMGDAGGLRRTITKVFRLDDGSLFGSCGSSSHMMEMLDWIKRGYPPSEVPPFQRTEDYQGVILVKPDATVWVWGQGPYPFKMEDPYTAMGHGRDFAIAAMYLGKKAVDAVNIACMFDPSCGMGCDWFYLEENIPF